MLGGRTYVILVKYLLGFIVLICFFNEYKRRGLFLYSSPIKRLVDTEEGGILPIYPKLRTCNVPELS